MITTPWLSFAVAVALGLLIGIERERSKGQGPERRPAGLRTFTLASLLGAMAFHAGGLLLLGIAIAAVATLAALSYLQSHETDPGLTTEIGLVATPILGAIAMSDAMLASGLAAAVAVIFAAKAPLHRFVKGVLTDAEVADGLLFAIATLVIWPQLPDRYMGPLLALNPHKLWLLVILILAIGACGHMATRALGARFGLPLSGLASGFVSSTATIGAMAGRAVKEAPAMAACVAGATLSTVATFVQMALLLFVIDLQTLVVIAPALAAGGMVAAIYGLVFTLAALRSTQHMSTTPGRAFSPKTALALLTTMVIVLVATAALKEWLGEVGLVVATAIAGLVDTHTAAISVGSLVAAGKLLPQNAVVPILAAMTANAFVKAIAAVSAGSRQFALRIVPGVVLTIASAWVVAIALRIV